MATRARRDRGALKDLGDWKTYYREIWKPMTTPAPSKPVGPADGMTLQAFVAARDAIFAAARTYDFPANCEHCTHFEMGDCKKHGQPVPKEFQQQAEACADWQYDGIPFASSDFCHDAVTSKQRRMRGYDF